MPRDPFADRQYVASTGHAHAVGAAQARAAPVDLGDHGLVQVLAEWWQRGIGHVPAAGCLAHAGFAQKRKTLRNSLSAGLKLSAGEIDSLLSAASINPQRRAETLSIKEWNQLTQAFQDFKRKPN